MAAVPQIVKKDFLEEAREVAAPEMYEKREVLGTITNKNTTTPTPKKAETATLATIKLPVAPRHAAHSASAARTMILRSLSTRPIKGKKTGRQGLERVMIVELCLISTTLATVAPQITCKSRSILHNHSSGQWAPYSQR